MKDLLRKGLDAYEGRREKRDEELAEVVGHHVDAMSHKPTLKIYVTVLAVTVLLLWAAVLIRPFDVWAALNKVSKVDERLVTLFLSVVFGIGMWLTYSLFRLRFPDLESTDHGSGPMSAFSAHENSTRKVRVWVVSVAGDVINLLALGIAESLLVSNR